MGLIPVFKYDQNYIGFFFVTDSRICALNSCDKRHSDKLIVNRQMT